MNLSSYFARYRREITLNVICNLLGVVFSLVSIPALVPFLTLLFEKELDPVPPPDWNAGGWDKYLQYFQYEFYQLIQTVGKEQALLYVCAFLIGVFFFKNLFYFLSLYFMASVRTGVVRDIRNELYDKFNELPLSYYSEKKKGDLLSRMSADVLEVESSILNVVETLVREPLMIIGCLGYMVYVSPSLTVSVVMMVAVMGGVIGTVGSRLKRDSTEAQSILGELVSHTEESLSGMRIIQAFNAQEHRKTGFRNTNDTYRNTLIPVYRRRDLSSPLSEFLGIGVVSILLLIGSRYVFSGETSPASFLAFLYAFFSVIQPAKAFSKAYYNIQKGRAASQRIQHILDEPNPIREVECPLPLEGFRQGISYQNVGYSYEPGTPVLRGVDLDVEKGQIVALVGPSGGGKSTLADLLPRFYDVETGRISLDGENIKNYALNDLRHLFGVVSQQPILFHDTIYNNIVFGREGVTPAQVEAAAKAAHAHDFILQTEQGYQTVIGDEGNKLSGGQKQRLTIARAILDNPPILILDEATSALDSASEKAVQEALGEVMQGRTVIVIAHRLSTIMHADQILVMEAGGIVERGTHAELVAKGGVYAELVEMQMG